jgi:hypothetical protein
MPKRHVGLDFIVACMYGYAILGACFTRSGFLILASIISIVLDIVIVGGVRGKVIVLVSNFCKFPTQFPDRRFECRLTD